MASHESDTKTQDFQDFFSAAEARIDRWRELSAVGRAWEAAASRGQAGETAAGNASRLLADVAALEEYWAYPGSRLMASVAEALREHNAAVFARLVGKISMALVTGSYRHDTGVWDPMEEGEGRVLDVLPPDVQTGETHKPYFEVLVVTPTTRAGGNGRAHELRRLRRPEDSFIYEIVHVGSFEDAVLGAIFNTNVQAVVIYDGFPFRSRHDMPGHARVPDAHIAASTPPPSSPARSRPRSRAAIKRVRPELDMYLLTDRAASSSRASDEVAPIRRVFYSVEELMEIHLAHPRRRQRPLRHAVLRQPQEVRAAADRHLPRAAHRPRQVGVPVELDPRHGPVLRHQPVPRRVVGDHGRARQPAGAHRQHQAGAGMAARAFGAKRAYFGTNGTSTSNKIVVQAVCRPGDIVIVDRNCHKSHHYGFVLAGAQPYYVEAFPLTQYSMYGAVPLRTIKKALLDLQGGGHGSTACGLVDLTNCTFDGHMYNPRAGDGGVPRDQAGPDLPVGRGVVRLRALQPVPPPAHRHGRGRRR